MTIFIQFTRTLKTEKCITHKPNGVLEGTTIISNRNTIEISNFGHYLG